MSNWKPINITFSVVEPTGGADDNLPPIILLHGMTMYKEDWGKIAQPLADATHRKVYKLDARNHGDSDWSDDFNFDVLGNDVNHFMESHGIPKAILIGHSMGGRTAMEVAGKHKEKVEKLIIEDMTTKNIMGEPTVKDLINMILHFKSLLKTVPSDCDSVKSANDFIKNLIKTSMPEPFKSDKLEDISDYTNNLKKTDQGFEWKMNIDVIYDKLLSENLLNEYQGFYDEEALFLYGPKSVIKIMEHKDDILKKFPKAIFKAIEDATHLIHQEYPTEFVTAVVDYIKSS